VNKAPGEKRKVTAAPGPAGLTNDRNAEIFRIIFCNNPAKPVLIRKTHFKGFL
jgi:hypothetical protein